jgi:SAM-dependent methyltransferase
MADTYSDFSDVCVKFYDLVVDPEQVASFVYEKIAQFNPRNCLFVGGFFLVAKELQKLGLNIVATDYTEAMVREGHDRLENTRIICADLRELPFNGCFDIVLTVGRVFTHMLNPEDTSRALQSIHRALKPGGAVLVDNYEDSKIQVTDYFNARVTVHDAGVRITRDSSTGLISCDPLVVRWKHCIE